MTFDQGHALLIGIGTYRDTPRLNVPVTAQDAEAVAVVLRDPQFAGYPPDQVTLLRDAGATRDAILAALDKLATTLKADDTLLLFYSGHGEFGADGFYLTSHDTQLNTSNRVVAGSGIREKELLEKLGAVKARRAILIFNACYSGEISPAALSGADQPEQVPGANLPDMLSTALLSTGEGRVIITACRENERSYFDRREPTTLFGQAVVDGLRGKDISSRKGYISLFDFYDYVYTTVSGSARRRWSVAQEPELTISKGVGVLALALYQGATPQGQLNRQDAPPAPLDVGHVREVEASESRRVLNQILNGQINLAAGGDIANVTVVGGDQQNIEVVSSGSGVTVGVLQGTLITAADQPAPVPNQVPPPPKKYIRREAPESELREALLRSTNSRPVVVLWGRPGTGSTTMAKYVVEQLVKDERLPGGVLWGDLIGRTTLDILRYFLDTLRVNWGESDSVEVLAPRLWQALDGRRDVGRQRSLVVLDEVRNAEQIAALLPERATNSRLLLVSYAPLEELDTRHLYKRCKVDSFSDDETLSLFRQVLPQATVEKYNDVLLQIGRRLDNLPQLVSSVAYALISSQLTPPAYLQRLEQSETQRTSLTAPIWQDLELITQTLSKDHAEIFDLTGILGDGDWSLTMLAAVALRPLAAVRQVVETLVNLDLVQRVGLRYRSGTLVREFARERFAQRPARERQASYYLLAYYCLGIAQDIKETLSARKDLRPPGQEGDGSDVEFVKAFQLALSDTLPHIRQVLEWTANNSSWELLRRFAFLPYVELEADLMTIGVPLQRDLQLATLIAPLVRATEAQLDLAAGQIIRGSFENVQLINTRWTGVRAAGLALKGVDVIGGEMLACELNQSLWVDCDARHANLSGSNFSYTVLRQVNLRGVNLQRSNLTGAVLDDVDLRGADLRGANLSGVRIRNLLLNGARIDDTRWAGAQGNILAEASITDEIEQAARQPADEPVTGPYAQNPGLALAARVERLADQSMNGADLRVVRFEGADLKKLSLNSADLRAAHFERAELDSIELNNADLRGARFDGASIRATKLNGADLRFVRFDGAKLERTELNDANLTLAQFATVALITCVLANANLRGANLRKLQCKGVGFEGADLRAANLAEARLTRVSFVGANLKEATFNHAGGRGVNFAGATLERATLKSAVLIQAHFGQANLHEAVLTNADLRGADFAEADLRGADLRGADLSTARNLNAAQLGAAAAMRGATMPDGSPYDGRLALEDDLAQAREQGIDLNDTAAMAAFYTAGQPAKRTRRRRAATTPPST